VRDHGRGIAPARREHVFEPFARLEHENGAAGAGLGLAIVREIAQAHGGSARAVDPPTGAGAQLEMIIPLDTTGVVA
jgi:signal transduction histidine kinase